MPTQTQYSKKQLKRLMERYTLEQLENRLFSDLPVKFLYECSQYGQTVSCHLRTSQGLVIEVESLVEWFEKLPEQQQAEILG